MVADARGGTAVDPGDAAEVACEIVACALRHVDVVGFALDDRLAAELVAAAGRRPLRRYAAVTVVLDAAAAQAAAAAGRVVDLLRAGAIVVVARTPVPPIAVNERTALAPRALVHPGAPDDGTFVVLRRLGDPTTWTRLAGRARAARVGGRAQGRRRRRPFPRETWADTLAVLVGE